uniref:uncharacterized protein LOC122609132 n=1 Tax=Erigeron canadensis TaxID=72917 RepID=UPI001CB9B1A1|nr:uncharacterized protein LOC122609132 [Erigeron canadensis]
MKEETVHSDPLALVVEKKSSRGSRKRRIELETDSEVSDVSDPELGEKDLEMYKELAYFTKAFKKKPTNNQLRSSSVSSYAKNSSVPKFETYKELVGDKKFESEKKFERKVLEKKNGERKCYNCGIPGHIATECTKPRQKNSEFYKYKLMLAKQEESGIALLAKDDKWVHLTDDETDELAANVCFMTKIKNSNELDDEAVDSTEEDDEVITIPKKVLGFYMDKSEAAIQEEHLLKAQEEVPSQYKESHMKSGMTDQFVRPSHGDVEADDFLKKGANVYFNYELIDESFDFLTHPVCQSNKNNHEVKVPELLECFKEKPLDDATSFPKPEIAQNHYDNKRNSSKTNTSICNQLGCSVCEIVNEIEQTNSENSKTSNQSTCSICEILNASVQTDLEVVHVSVQTDCAQDQYDDVSVDPNDIYFDTSIPKFSEDTQTYLNEFNDAIKKFEKEKDQRIKVVEN